MNALTGVLYAVLVVYLGGWFFDKWSGNFSLVLLLMSLVTFAYWLAEIFHFLPARRRVAAALVAADAEKRAKWSAQGLKADNTDIEHARQVVLRQPWWLDWTAGLFPVILMVFVLRSFLFEPFRIPSGSMVPTLLVGDLILVNKFHYGVRLPVINHKVLDINPVKRGDVMVFRFPPKPTVDYIKRVVGLPGDEIEWRNQRLFVNGQEAPSELQGPFFDQSSLTERTRFTEKLGEVSHGILVERNMVRSIRQDPGMPFAENCTTSIEGVVCKVPAGHYFMMGDNRDNSEDSRYWGFVPDRNIVGKATLVWMNFSDLGRVGFIR